MKKYLLAVILSAVIITSTSCIIIKSGVPETASMTVVSSGSTITSGSTVTSRVLSISGTVHNPGGATATSFEGSAYIVVNNDTFDLALSFSTGNEWVFSHSVAIVRGNNVIIILIYDLDNNLYEKSPEFTIHGDFPAYPLRIQLTWNTDGNDIDLHVYYFSSATATTPSYHTWYSAMEPTDYSDGLYGIPNAYLDFDDTDGYGPENFTLEQLPVSGVFKAFLRYYSGSVTTTATVKVYQSDTLVYTGSHTFTADQANNDDPSNDWYFYTAEVVNTKIKN